MSFKVIFSETFAIVHLCLVYTYSSRTDNSCFQVAQDFLTLSQVGTDNFSSPWLAYFCELKTSVIFVTANAIASSTSCLNSGFSELGLILMTKPGCKLLGRQKQAFQSRSENQ